MGTEVETVTVDGAATALGSAGRAEHADAFVPYP